MSWNIYCAVNVLWLQSQWVMWRVLMSVSPELTRTTHNTCKQFTHRHYTPTRWHIRYYYYKHSHTHTYARTHTCASQMGKCYKICLFLMREWGVSKDKLHFWWCLSYEQFNYASFKPIYKQINRPIRTCGLRRFSKDYLNFDVFW